MVSEFRCFGVLSATSKAGKPFYRGFFGTYQHSKDSNLVGFVTIDSFLEPSDADMLMKELESFPEGVDVKASHLYNTGSKQHILYNFSF